LDLKLRPHDNNSFLGYTKFSNLNLAFSLFLSTEKYSVKKLKEAILDDSQQITGALLDSYVAGFWAHNDGNSVLKDDNLRVGTVIDHQFAYGFVVGGDLVETVFTKCLRQRLNRMETDITSIIQRQANTMEVSQS
jgi:hypothetical protein